MLPESPGAVWSFRVQDQPDDNDLTFFVVSDLHYGGTVNFRLLNRQTVQAMNSLPGQLYPEDKGVKGKVHTPRGVVITGDIVNDGSAPDIEKTWQEYVEDYGLNGDKLLAFPVYEGFGESDGPSSGLVRANLKSRNRLRPGLRSISADGLHYSWDWGQVHFVQLNLYPGSAGEEYLNIWRRRISGDARYPKHSLEFLIDDLRRNVGSSGRPVVLFEHYGFDSWSEAFWTEKKEVLSSRLFSHITLSLFSGDIQKYLKVSAGMVSRPGVPGQAIMILTRANFWWLKLPPAGKWTAGGGHQRN